MTITQKDVEQSIARRRARTCEDAAAAALFLAGQLETGERHGAERPSGACGVPDPVGWAVSRVLEVRAFGLSSERLAKRNAEAHAALMDALDAEYSENVANLYPLMKAERIRAIQAGRALTWEARRLHRRAGGEEC